jgi:phospholipid/cholesterol/gamma-HCH transport system ATP-binding protein
VQLEPSDGNRRATQREPGEWCRANGVTPPPGSFGQEHAMSEAQRASA